jgi:hypothetical protein
MRLTRPTYRGTACQQVLILSPNVRTHTYTDASVYTVFRIVKYMQKYFRFDINLESPEKEEY